MKREDLKIGDTIIVEKLDSNQPSLDTVERLTKTQIITKKGAKFSKKDGCEVGIKGYYARKLIVPTKDKLFEVHQDIYKKTLVKVLENFKSYDELSIETLEMLFATVGIALPKRDAEFCKKITE